MTISFQNIILFKIETCPICREDINHGQNALGHNITESVYIARGFAVGHAEANSHQDIVNFLRP